MEIPDEKFSLARPLKKVGIYVIQSWNENVWYLRSASDIRRRLVVWVKLLPRVLREPIAMREKRIIVRELLLLQLICFEN